MQDRRLDKRVSRRVSAASNPIPAGIPTVLILSSRLHLCCVCICPVRRQPGHCDSSRLCARHWLFRRVEHCNWSVTSSCTSNMSGPAATRRAPHTINASTLVVVHTYLAYAAFFSALAIGSYLHFKKIVKNGIAGWPEEWFPSVSAT